MRILNRQNIGKNICPKCRMVNVDFLDLGESLLGCLQCGMVFISRDGLQTAIRFRNSEIVRMREDNREDSRDVLEEQEEVWNCDCGMICKSKAGLLAHQRVCDYIKC